MFKRMIIAAMTFAVLVGFTFSGEAATGNNWLIYWYICGSNLESDSYYATKDIAEMQHVKLPPNMKILIYASGTSQWHHPTLKAGGDGIYLYSSNRLEKVANFKENMGDPNTLSAFLKFGEDNFSADHKVMFFWNHGGLGGVCYDDNFRLKDGFPDYLSYNELNRAFSNVYGTSPENPPFELIGFKACLTGSYELANSIADFSRYMLGAEPSIYDTPFKDWIEALAKNPSMNGIQIGKAFGEAAMKNYANDMNFTHIFSVIDLTKMPELRKAYEAYFDEALKRSNEEGFLGAFSRSAEARNVDKYSNLYTDLGLLAKNTKSIMPKTSSDLLTAIDNAVVYSKRGEYLKSKGISTFYPYISKERIPEVNPVNVTNSNINVVLSQNSNCKSQMELYKKILNVKDLSALEGNNSVPLDINSNNRIVANLTSEQLENISSVYSVLIPVKENYTSELGFDLGGAILTSTEDLKIDWTKGTVTENFRPVEPMFDGHRIVMIPFVSGHKHTLYKVPIIHEENYRRDLIVSYDTSKNTYSIIGFGSSVENGTVRSLSGKPKEGEIITPIYLILSEDPSPEFVGVEVNEEKGKVVTEIDEETGKKEYRYASSILGSYTHPQTGKTVYWKWIKGTPFVYTKDATITNSPIDKGNFFYFLEFESPSGIGGVMSLPAAIIVDHGKVEKISTDTLMLMAQIAENEQ